MRNFIRCALFLGVFSALCFAPTITNAARIYCSTDSNSDDWYVETSAISGTRSKLTYSQTYSSSGKHLYWTFQNWHGEYEYKVSTSNDGSGNWRKVKDNQLANDVLYVTMIEKKKMR